MSDEQKFGSCVFGGFKKDDVLKYIDGLLNEHEAEIEELKKEYADENENIKRELEERDSYITQQEERIQELEEVIEAYGEEISEEENKDEKLKQNEKKIAELEENVDKLKKQLQVFEQDEKKNEYDIKRAEYIAREKVNQIVRKGKARAEMEYNERLERWKKEKEILKNKAFEEASKILNNAAARVFNFNSQVKGEIKNFVESAKQEAGKIIESAKCIADKILKESAKIASKQSKSFNITEFKIDEQFNTKDLDRETDEEVLNALQRLKGLDVLEKNNTGMVLKENVFKRHRKKPFESFRRKNRE